VLKVAVGGDGATRTIRILFGLDIAAFAVLLLSAISWFGVFIYILYYDEKKKESNELKKNQTPDKEK
jgi:mannose/fructose/N-acetylgalactosamine-specific phosphotransferase system component IIC